MLEIGENISWRKRGREANSRQKTSSAASFLLRVSLAGKAGKGKWEAAYRRIWLGDGESKRTATLHFMSASRILPLITTRTAIALKAPAHIQQDRRSLRSQCSTPAFLEIAQTALATHPGKVHQSVQPSS